MGRGHTVRWLAVAAGVALGAVACRQLVGIGDAPPGAGVAADAGEAGDAGGVSGLPYTGACATCVQTSCPAEATACTGSPSCAPFASCVAACGGDPACRSGCTTSAPLPSSSGELDALSACVVKNCETVCGLLCGGLEYLSSPDSAVDCQHCIADTSELCSYGTACGSLADCHAFAGCSIACQGRLDCREACVAAHDAGVTAFAPVLADILASCEVRCALGGDWQCLGHVAEPYPSAPGSCAMRMQVVDAADPQLPLAGVEVSFCNEGLCSSEATTDAEGVAHLAIPLVPDVPGATGYLSFHSPADAGEPAVVPTLFYWGFPLTQPAVTYGYPPPDAGTPVVYSGLSLVSPLELAALASQVDVSLDAARGQVGVAVTDCLGTVAPGVQVDSPQADAQSGRFYSVGSSAGASLSKTSTMTDASGTMVFTNMPPGSVDLVATLAGQSTPIARITVLVQPGVITMVYLPPTQ